MNTGILLSKREQIESLQLIDLAMERLIDKFKEK
jgi:hypothetical protein